MPRAKKKPLNMTTEEAMRKLFPKKAKDEARPQDAEAVAASLRSRNDRSTGFAVRSSARR